ncbi:MAG: RtcB family protein [Acidimicrobiia bacterium]|nr:RtcB family protein [Acidimicrobiia bacterium]
MPVTVGNVLTWDPDLDDETLAQAGRAASLPFIAGHVALMPDAHVGLGCAVGAVIPTTGAIIPAAVGVDIGCGMIAVETTLTASDLPDDMSGLLSRIERVVPAGVGRGHQRHRSQGSALRTLPRTELTDKQMDRAVSQMGSLGSGNHFVEICLDPGDTVWVVLHSGSRGIGNQLARRHIDTAKGLMKEYATTLPGGDTDLAYLTEGTPEFETYLADLLWAQDYARQNREAMMNAVLGELGTVAGGLKERRRINCHHNYTARERHSGKTIWVTRKGAIRAEKGDAGVIPGSMGTNTFIVRGLGNPESFNSSAHGAGRRMSRTRAKRELSAETLREKMGGRAWLADRADRLVDEHPDAYKDIDQVMRFQADLAAIEVELHQVLNYKGT